MNVDQYCQLLMGNGYVAKYGNLEHYLVNPYKQRPLIQQAESKEVHIEDVYHSYTGTPSNYIPYQQQNKNRKSKSEKRKKMALNIIDENDAFYY